MVIGESAEFYKCSAIVFEGVSLLYLKSVSTKRVGQDVKQSIVDCFCLFVAVILVCRGSDICWRPMKGWSHFTREW